MPDSTLLRRLKDVSIIQVPVKTSLRCANLVSLTQAPVGTSLRRLKLVGFNYVLVRRHKDVSNRSAESTYQLLLHDDASVWSGTFKLVTKMNQFLLHTMQYTSLVSQVAQSLQATSLYVAATSQRRCSQLGTRYDVCVTC